MTRARVYLRHTHTTKYKRTVENPFNFCGEHTLSVHRHAPPNTQPVTCLVAAAAATGYDRRCRRQAASADARGRRRRRAASRKLCAATAAFDSGGAAAATDARRGHRQRGADRVRLGAYAASQPRQEAFQTARSRVAAAAKTRRADVAPRPTAYACRRRQRRRVAIGDERRPLLCPVGL